MSGLFRHAPRTRMTWRTNPRFRRPSSARSLVRTQCCESRKDRVFRQIDPVCETERLLLSSSCGRFRRFLERRGLLFSFLLDLLDRLGPMNMFRLGIQNGLNGTSPGFGVHVRPCGFASSHLSFLRGQLRHMCLIESLLFGKSGTIPHGTLVLGELPPLLDTCSEDRRLSGIPGNDDLLCLDRRTHAKADDRNCDSISLHRSSFFVNRSRLLFRTSADSITAVRLMPWTLRKSLSEWNLHFSFARINDEPRGCISRFSINHHNDLRANCETDSPLGLVVTTARRVGLKGGSQKCRKALRNLRYRRNCETEFRRVTDLAGEGVCSAAPFR